MKMRAYLQLCIANKVISFIMLSGTFFGISLTLMFASSTVVFNNRYQAINNKDTKKDPYTLYIHLDNTW